MNRRFSLDCWRSIMLGALAILAVAFAGNNAYASKFWGIITAGSVQDFGYDDFTARGYYLCEMAQIVHQYSPESDDGYGIGWYIPNVLPIVVGAGRTKCPIYDENDDCVSRYVNTLDAVYDAEARIVLGHARGNNSTKCIPGPHPFIYRRFNDFVAMAHNGTIEWDPPNSRLALLALEDSIGAGFAALDSIVNREWTSWRYTAGSDIIVDTEYYMVLFMKQLLVAENYYWTAAPLQFNTPMRWAIGTTLDKIIALTPGYRPYTSLNAEITTKDTLWLICKVYDGYGDSHETSYWQPTEGEDIDIRVGSTTVPAGFTELNSGQSIALVPNQNHSPFNCTGVFNDYERPDELRINPAASAAGDQSTAAISADPVKSTFATVWKTTNGNDIMLRWYNQMGLAEGNEFRVNNWTVPDTRSPAIAHSPNGDTVMVVWSEKPSGSTVFSQIKARKFTWWPQHLTWIGQPEFVVSASTNFDLDRPAVARRVDGGWAVVWEKFIPATGNYEIRWSAVSPTASITDQLLSTGCDSRKPDVAAFNSISGARYVFAWDGLEVGLRDPGRVYCCSVTNDALQLGTTTAIYLQSTVSKFLNPALVSVDGSLLGDFVVGYFAHSNGYLQAKRARANADGTITVLSTITDISQRFDTPPELDVALRFDQTVEMCYDMTTPTAGLEVYFMVSAGTSFGTPYPVPTVDDALFPTQSRPRLAISHTYQCNSTNHDPGYYQTISANDVFYQRRMIVWQSKDQDGGGWGIVGRFYGIATGDEVATFWKPDLVNGLSGNQATCASDSTALCEGQPIVGDDPHGSRTPFDESQGSREASESLPTQFQLYQPTPNPFNPTTTIHFDLPMTAHVVLNVYDLRGRLVTTLVDDVRPAGSHGLVFDGSSLSSGTYFVRMEADGYVNVQKMLLIK